MKGHARIDFFRYNPNSFWLYHQSFVFVYYLEVLHFLGDLFCCCALAFFSLLEPVF